MRVDVHVHSQKASLRPQQAENETKEIQDNKKGEEQNPPQQIKGGKGEDKQNEKRKRKK